MAQRLPFFYGWVMEAAIFMSGMASSGPTLWAFSVFAVPMAEDMGWNRATIVITPDDKLAYVTNKEGENVSVIDLKTRG